MADVKISQLPAATTPVSGTEELPLVQSGVTKKIALSDLSSISFGATGLTPATATSGAVVVAGTLDVNNGGTGLATLTANNVILGNGTSTPTFVAPSTSGKVLTSNGTTWVSSVPATSGTVTSVAMTVPSVLSISGSPITSSGTLALTYSGTALPVLNGGTGVTTSTGTTNVVLSNSPTLVTPVLGAATGTSFQGIIGNVTPAAGTFTTITGAILGRVVVIADATSITVNTDTTDIATQANTQAIGTLTINAPTGTAVNGQKFILRLTSTNVQTFSWNAVFAGSTDITLPTVSSGSSKTDYVGFIYNSTAVKWQMVAKVFGF